MAFLQKIVTVNLNSQQKFHDNDASAGLRRLTANRKKLSTGVSASRL